MTDERDKRSGGDLLKDLVTDAINEHLANYFIEERDRFQASLDSMHATVSSLGAIVKEYQATERDRLRDERDRLRDHTEAMKRVEASGRRPYPCLLAGARREPNAHPQPTRVIH